MPPADECAKMWHADAAGGGEESAGRQAEVARVGEDPKFC